MGRKRIHPIKERVAPKVKRKGRFEKPEKIETKEPELLTYMVYLRGTGPKDPNKPKTFKAKSLVEVIKYSAESFGKDRLLEVHDYRGNLIWGKNTGINKEHFVR
jgi:hypothetical protein